jgi:hypothetical protein
MRRPSRAILFELATSTRFEVFGVRPGDADALAAAGHRVRLYAPFGPGWFRPWMR